MPNNLKIIRITAIISKVCRVLPVRGWPVKIFGPKYPGSHPMIRIIMIQVSWLFLLEWVALVNGDASWFEYVHKHSQI